VATSGPFSERAALSLVANRIDPELRPPGPGARAERAASFASSARAIFLKDLVLWMRQPLQVLGSLLVPVSYTLVVFLGAHATSREPAAVVNLDRGPVGAHLAQAIVNADVFRVYEVSPARASQMYADLQVSTVITIPPDLSQRVAAHEQVPVDVRANNLNFDLAGDIRRSVPDAITTYYQGLGRASPVKVTIAETHLRPRDIQLYQYSVLPVIILIVTVNGIISTGMAVAGEFEKRTVKELLLAPISRFTIIAGKMMAGFLSTFVLATAMLVVGAAANFTRPQGLYWLEAIGAIALSSAFSAGLGIAIGTWFQRKQPVSVGATIAAVELFALAGGIGVIFFEPLWLQRIAAFDPLTYGIHALQMAVFYNSSDDVLRDFIVLACASAAAAAAGTLAMRRRLIAH
jgi:ABC-2 type transport system permease protein